MQSDYRVKKLVTEEGGDVVAICYDVLYGETFEKYIGIPDDFDARENAANLLQDSNYEISDKIRAELEETFGLEEFEDDQDYDSYQFYDFGDDDFEEDEDEIDELVYAGNANGISTEDEEEFAIPTRFLKRESFNLREALNQIDLNTYNKYDLLNLYESCNLSENEKRALANIVYDQNDPSVIYDTLNDRFLGKEIEMPERVKDGVIHEDTTDRPVEFKAGYHEWNVLVNGEIIYSFGDFGETLEGCTDKDTLGYEVEDCIQVMLDELNESGKNIQLTNGEFDALKNQMVAKLGYHYLDLDESKSIKESDGKSLTEGFYRGCKGVTMIGHGAWSDPELEYNGYLFNYWDIEDALWYDFLEGTGYSDAQSEEPKVEEEFNAYVKERCVDYLDDCIYGGAFTGLSIEGDVVEFSNGDYYYVGYKDGKISLDNAYNAGRAPEYSIDYDFEESIDANLQRLYDHAIEKTPWLNGDDELDESVEDEPYTKEQIEQDLKSITKNFTSKEGELKCGFVEEKNSAVEILKQHYKVVETSGDDRRDGTWYHISFADPIEK